MEQSIDYNAEDLQTRVDELDVVAHQIATCLDCDLCRSRTKTVPGWFPKHALKQPVRICFIGEAPGYYEDLDGEVFVGRSGEKLDSLLESIGLNRRQVCITNVLHCRPPNNRTPTLDEMYICAIHTYRQLGLLQPDLVIALGVPAAYFITLLQKYNPQNKLNIVLPKMAEVRNRIINFVVPGVFGIPTWDCQAIVTYHPSAQLRSAQYTELAEKDFNFIRRTIDSIKKKKRIDEYI